MARNHLLKAIHSYPTDRQLYDQLLALSIGNLRDYREPILRLSQSVASVQHLSSVSALSAGHTRNAFKRAQSAVHMYPGMYHLWLFTDSVDDIVMIIFIITDYYSN